MENNCYRKPDLGVLLRSRTGPPSCLKTSIETTSEFLTDPGPVHYRSGLGSCEELSTENCCQNEGRFPTYQSGLLLFVAFLRRHLPCRNADKKTAHEYARKNPPLRMHRSTYCDLADARPCRRFCGGVLANPSRRVSRQEAPSHHRCKPTKRRICKPDECD